MNQKTPGQGHFVNDLLRTEFHRFLFHSFLYEYSEGTDLPLVYRKFMAKFIKVCSSILLPFTFLTPLFLRLVNQCIIDIHVLLLLTLIITTRGP